ncbi:N-acetyltransferase [Altericroceibacterium spongiae]|uniref:N-acetyltransferase n=1 Tax=Altericroceibacterium spongiae TaxID=2320269 RepID=A0A420EIN8_9SPHN|nr:GNAT family N-acetyltransferase [Altericroceibacterium spongiae]RKF20524.1 N-acetyltransferase [Altericroceibacterium spongiae]
MDEKIEIQREDHVTHGAYTVALPNSGEQAELTWQAAGEARIADHTYVPDAMRGKGIAAELVKALVADAREKGFTVVPQCSYVDAAFRRHPEWADILAETES